MLVLARKLGKSIVIEVPPSTKPRKITVTFCSLFNHSARIGVDVQPPDRSVVILRDELVEKLQCEEKTRTTDGNSQ
jgi:sRNA-binding carbon storage regulator CsrA